MNVFCRLGWCVIVFDMIVLIDELSVGGSGCFGSVVIVGFDSGEMLSVEMSVR